jgi:hypothetical protein
LLSAVPPPVHNCSAARATASIDLYGTFHAMGVIVTIAPDDDPDQDALAAVAYRTDGAAYWDGLPLARVADTRFVGSLFGLQPGTTYDVRVTLSDPDGGPLDGAQVTASAATRAQIAIPTPVHTYYVAPEGTGNACTLAAPCSLPEGLSRAQPGDQVVLRGGVYHQGDLALPRSGTAGAPIVIRGYPDENAVLDGADPATFSWTHMGDGIYRTTVNAPDPHLIVADGERLLPYQSLSDLELLAWGVPGFYATDTTVYVHLAGNGDPNSVAMAVARYNRAFYVAQDHVAFLDLTFRHYGQGSHAKAIYLDGASDNLVQGCTFALNDLGIGVKRASHRNVIQDSQFYDTIFDWPWDAFYAGIALSSGGITFYDPATGRGNVIRRNTFHDLFDGFGVCPSSTAGVTNETDVYHNLVYRAGDDGMETDGQCSNVRIWGNTFHDVLMGISLAPTYTGPTYAIRNLIYRTGVGNNTYTGSPFKFNSGYGRSGPMFLFHNTADAALPGNNGLYVKAPGSWDQINARNNVWAGTDHAIHNDNAGQPIDLDYDALWTDPAHDLVRWDGTRYDTLAAFTAATGQEPHALNVAPGFADPEGGLYALGAQSGLIDTGVILPGINDRGPAAYVGAAPDVGAFEAPACALAADLDRDGDVDVADVILVAERWRTTAADPAWNARYDLEPDGAITVVDLMQAAAHWGDTCPP